MAVIAEKISDSGGKMPRALSNAVCSFFRTFFPYLALTPTATACSTAPSSSCRSGRKKKLVRKMGKVLKELIGKQLKKEKGGRFKRIDWKKTSKSELLKEERKKRDVLKAERLDWKTAKERKTF